MIEGPGTIATHLDGMALEQVVHGLGIGWL
jgi:hypothetical protein